MNFAFGVFSYYIRLEKCGIRLWSEEHKYRRQAFVIIGFSFSCRIIGSDVHLVYFFV